MKKRTRAWRRWMERGARWGLTLLLVALVGVTVASGWWRLVWGRLVRSSDPVFPSTVVFVEIRRGSLSYDPIPSPHPYRPVSRLKVEREAVYGQRSDGVTVMALTGAPPPQPFNLWRAATGSGQFVVALTYPTLAVALPALFLWYRRLFRRYGRGFRRYGRGRCQRCGYDLAGLTTAQHQVTCPECGASTHAPKPKTA